MGINIKISAGVRWRFISKAKPLSSDRGVVTRTRIELVLPP